MENPDLFAPDMKPSPKILLIAAVKRFFCFIGNRSLVFILTLTGPRDVRAAETGRTYATPEEAVAALVAATSAQDTNALHGIFGPATSEIANPDPVQAAKEQSAFTKALNEGTRILRKSDSQCVLEVGDRRWPFPIPIVKKDDRWFFDTEAGKEEVLNRRIGRNELATLQVVRTYVEAQREYASRDRDGDEVLEYAQRLISSSGTHDGLYWPPDSEGETSPLGPLVAYAQGKGYALDSTPEGTPGGPFHGYYFKILTRQGRHAPGGKCDYVINGKMIAGFALVAWPARYGDSGIMTFIVNQQGRVYQKDLGAKTSELVEHMKAYDPDPTWQVSSD
jgi:hypothetical protein